MAVLSRSALSRPPYETQHPKPPVHCSQARRLGNRHRKLPFSRNAHALPLVTPTLDHLFAQACMSLTMAPSNAATYQPTDWSACLHRHYCMRDVLLFAAARAHRVHLYINLPLGMLQAMPPLHVISCTPCMHPVSPCCPLFGPLSSTLACLAFPGPSMFVYFDMPQHDLQHFLACRIQNHWHVAAYSFLPHFFD